MRTAQQILGALLVIGAAVTLFYWWSYFHGGEVMVVRERWYAAFESSFPVADGWMALCMLVSGAGFLMQRRFAAIWGLMAGSALLYLAAMDITFNVENGLYALVPLYDTMKFEVFINASSLVLGALTLWASYTALVAREQR